MYRHNNFILFIAIVFCIFVLGMQISIWKPFISTELWWFELHRHFPNPQIDHCMHILLSHGSMIFPWLLIVMFMSSFPSMLQKNLLQPVCKWMKINHVFSAGVAASASASAKYLETSLCRDEAGSCSLQMFMAQHTVTESCHRNKNYVVAAIW